MRHAVCMWRFQRIWKQDIQCDIDNRDTITQTADLLDYSTVIIICQYKNYFVVCTTLLSIGFPSPSTARKTSIGSAKITVLD